MIRQQTADFLKQLKPNMEDKRFHRPKWKPPYGDFIKTNIDDADAGNGGWVVGVGFLGTICARRCFSVEGYLNSLFR